jgi:spore coat polysaccharide biosynthesis protein SpsF (cytidylyltransferase family)
LDGATGGNIAIANATGIHHYRGHTEDVLLRYQGAAEEFSVDQIVIADGDDLFVEPSLILEVESLLRSQRADFVSVKDMPYGSFPYGMSRTALQKVCSIKDENETEGWGRYFTQTGLFRTHTINAPQKWCFPQYRMTLDYPEDLDFVRTVYERLYQPGRPLVLTEVFALLEKEPEIAAINSGRQEEYLARFRSKYSHVKVKKDV